MKSNNLEEPFNNKQYKFERTLKKFAEKLQGVKERGVDSKLVEERGLDPQAESSGREHKEEIEEKKSVHWNEEITQTFVSSEIFEAWITSEYEIFTWSELLTYKTE